MKLMHNADFHIGKHVNEFSMLDNQKYLLFFKGVTSVKIFIAGPRALKTIDKKVEEGLKK